MAEEWVYIARKKIRVLMIERPLEGEAPVSMFLLTTINNTNNILKYLN